MAEIKVSMSPDFDGPYFSPDLIGPDGRLTRLHKGGQHKANALAKSQLEQQKRESAAARKRSQQAAARAQAAARQSAARAAAEQKQNAALLEQLSQEDAPTEYIDDRRKKRTSRGRSAFGLAATRSGTGLGGNRGSLG